MTDAGYCIRDCHSGDKLIRIFQFQGYWMALTPDDDIVPVTQWFDGEGDDCDGPEEALSCVAGTEEGPTYAISLEVVEYLS